VVEQVGKRSGLGFALLKRFQEVTNRAGFGKSWAELFDKDIAIAKGLLANGKLARTSAKKKPAPRSKKAA